MILWWVDDNAPKKMLGIIQRLTMAHMLLLELSETRVQPLQCPWFASQKTPGPTTIFRQPSSFRTPVSISSSSRLVRGTNAFQLKSKKKGLGRKKRDVKQQDLGITTAGFIWFRTSHGGWLWLKFTSVNDAFPRQSNWFHSPGSWLRS